MGDAKEPENTLLSRSEYEALFEAYKDYRGLVKILANQDRVLTDYRNPPEALEDLHEVGAVKYTIVRDSKYASLTSLGEILLETTTDDLGEFVEFMMEKEEEFRDIYS